MNGTAPLPAPRSGSGPAALRNLHSAGLLLLALAAGPAAARGWLGVSIQDVTPELVEAIGLTARSGALISDVVPDGPADHAGMTARDVIVRAGEVTVESAEDLIEILKQRSPGDEVVFTLFRGAEQREVPAILSRAEEHPGEDRPPSGGDRTIERFVLPGRAGPERGARLGVTVHELTDGLAPYFQAKPGGGVLILSVERESPAEEAGIRSGDVLLRFQDEEVAGPSDLRRAVARLDAGDRWSAALLRSGRQIEASGRMRASAPREGRERELLRPPRSRDREEPDEGLSGRQIRRLRREIERIREQLERLEEEIRRGDR